MDTVPAEEEVEISLEPLPFLQGSIAACKASYHPCELHERIAPALR